MINVALDTKMMYGGTLDGRYFTKGADPAKNTKNTRGNTRESLKPTRTITHVLDPRNAKRVTRSKVNKGQYKR